MEVKINKEIRNYTESMFFGLSLRQFIFSLLAVGVAVGLYFLLRSHFGTETLSWMCILGAAPFAVMGFVRYNGMNAEQFVWAWFKSEFMMPKKLLFVSMISPIHAINWRANSSSSIPARIRPTVAGDGTPFFSGIYRLSQSRCLLHHFRVLRIVSRPTRNPITRHTRVSAWSCFVALPHLGSGTAFIYISSCFVW